MKSQLFLTAGASNEFRAMYQKTFEINKNMCRTMYLLFAIVALRFFQGEEDLCLSLSQKKVK